VFVHAHIFTHLQRTQDLIVQTMAWLDFDYTHRQLKAQEQMILQEVNAHAFFQKCVFEKHFFKIE
jgi:hypothetical protein